MSVTVHPRIHLYKPPSFLQRIFLKFAVERDSRIESNPFLKFARQATSGPLTMERLSKEIYGCMSGVSDQKNKEEGDLLFSITPPRCVTPKELVLGELPHPIKRYRSMAERLQGRKGVGDYIVLPEESTVIQVLCGKKDNPAEQDFSVFIDPQGTVYFSMQRFLEFQTPITTSVLLRQGQTPECVIKEIGRRYERHIQICNSDSRNSPTPRREPFRSWPFS
jgi:hypothetical protein